MSFSAASAAASLRLGTVAGFGVKIQNRPFATLHPDSRLQSSPSRVQEQTSDADEHQQRQHPHSKLWRTTLDTSPNGYVNPAVELAIRPPSEGGTGILAVDDLPADAVALCLPLEEVGMIDAASILDSYNEEDYDERDEVMCMLKDMWNKELSSSKSKENSEEGKRLAVLAGLVAHLQLTRYKDLTSWTANAVKEGHALEQSRRLGLFLDAMPLLPQHDEDATQHPFPTHFLYWTDDEVQILLQGTMGQTKAREVRAGIGLVVREWSSAFLKEHSSGATQTQILNAIFSAFTAVLSRSFGDAAGRDLDGKGRMLVPLVDMLNHDGEDPNVRWTWHVGEGDEDKIEEGKGDIVVTTLREVKKGEELFKCYGWRPAWDIATSYGFVPALKKERWECAVIPLFPSVLDLTPDSIPTPNSKANDETSLDLLLETNYGPLVKAVLAAVDAANEIEARQRRSDGDNTANEAENDRPEQINRLEVVSLFRPPPALTREEFPFPRRQPCVVAGTKIQAVATAANDHYHRHAIQSILPAFRAAASAVSQLRTNYQSSSDNASSVSASQMAMAAASIDKSTDWDALAIQMIRDGISDRLKTLSEDGKAADAWLSKRNDASGMDDRENRDHRQFRAGVARDVRESEMIMLRALQNVAKEW